jgi:hypothetical protein
MVIPRQREKDLTSVAGSRLVCATRDDSNTIGFADRMSLTHCQNHAALRAAPDDISVGPASASYGSAGKPTQRRRRLVIYAEVAR